MFAQGLKHCIPLVKSIMFFSLLLEIDQLIFSGNQREEMRILRPFRQSYHPDADGEYERRSCALHCLRCLAACREKRSEKVIFLAHSDTMVDFE